MNLLIDTHVLIWWARNSRRLGKGTRELIASPRNSVWVSAASIWEISIKASLRRLDIDETLAATITENLDRHGFSALPIQFVHAVAVRNLPFHHSDPFDRMLIAQAQCEGLTLVTADPAFAAYDIRTIDGSL